MTETAQHRTIDELYRWLRSLPPLSHDLHEAVERIVAPTMIHRASGGYDAADASTWRHDPSDDLSRENAAVLDRQAARNRVVDLRGGW